MFFTSLNKRKGVSRPSLVRITKLLELMGNPHLKCKFVHIAGTNGKGSITTTMANILMKSGYKVGKYISPFVDCPAEEIQINNKYISERELNNYYRKLRIYFKKMKDKPTVYEITAAIAFQYFADNNCDIIALEVSMGGRFDSTNVIGTPLVSIISVIDFDHIEFLGNKIEEIAFEKCGIIKPNGVTVSYPLQLETAEKMIKSIIDIRNNVLITPDINSLKNIECLGLNYGFTYKNIYYMLGLNGKHQVYNALVCIEATNQLRHQGFKINDKDVVNAIADTRFIGRMETVSNKPLTIFDGAHNPSAARVLGEFLSSQRANHEKIIMIAGLIIGKDHKQFFDILAPLVDVIIITEIRNRNKKSADTCLLSNFASAHCGDVRIVKSQEEAYATAKNLCGKDDMIVETGSLYLLSEMRKAVLN